MNTLKDKSGVDKIIVKKQPYQLLNTIRELFPSFYVSNFHKLVEESSYINDLYDGVHSDIKLFADDTSIFSVIKDKDEATETLNQNLEKVRLWAWQWQMQLNCDKTEEVIFSVKRSKTEHPSLKLGLDEVARKDEDKHLGLILDYKLDCKIILDRLY